MPVPVFGKDKVAFVQAVGDELLRLEALHGVSKRDVVDNLIEDTCWSESAGIRDYVGGKGSDQERLDIVLRCLKMSQTA